jgi:hypothetical protein
MADNTAALAAMLAAQLPEGFDNAAGVLFTAATASGYTPVPPSLPASDVAAALRSSAHIAESAVQACRDPEVLSRAARDQRVRLRRLVAANPYTATADLEVLWDKATATADPDLFNAVAKRIPVAKTLATWSAARHAYRDGHGDWACVVRCIANRLIDSGSPGAWEEVLCAPDPYPVELAAALLAAAQAPVTDAVTPAMPFAAALALVPDEHKGRAVSAALSIAPRISGELATAFARHGSWEWFSELFHCTYDLRIGGSYMALDTDAVDVFLVDAPWSSEALTTLHGAVPPDRAVQVLAHLRERICDPEKGSVRNAVRCARFVLAEHAVRLPASEVEELFAAVASAIERSACNPMELREFASTLVAKRLPADASPELVFTVVEHYRQALRNLFASTKSVVDGRAVRQLQRGELAAWVAGDVTTYGDSGMFGAPSNRALLVEETLSATALDAEYLLRAPWADEALDVTGDHAYNVLSANPAFRKLVAWRAVTALGDDADAWTTFTALAADGLGTERLADLLAAVRAIIPAAEPVVGPNGQILLPLEGV